jgi:hypothetical protein
MYIRYVNLPISNAMGKGVIRFPDMPAMSHGTFRTDSMAFNLQV